jgi:medium-chain acyl-[acyl-carrier-protein] hydrolase
MSTWPSRIPQRYLRSEARQAGLRLYGELEGGGRWVTCFPPAGGNASAFRALAAALGPGWTVAALDPPGHGLWPGPPLESVAALLEVARELLPADAEAGVLVGASLGGYVAHHLALALESEGKAPRALVLLGTPPYRHRARCLALGELEGEALLDALSALGGLPPELRASPATLELFLRPLKADLRAFHGVVEPRGKLACRVAVFGGLEDRLAPPHLFADWREVVEQARVELLPGPHLLLDRCAAELAAGIQGLWEADAPRLS